MKASGSYRVNSLAEHLISVLLFILLILTLVMLNGCGTLSNGRNWGQDATWNPGWAKIKDAAIDAALSPETWGPAAGALVLQIDDMDERISDWASEKTPVFGSRENADKWSDYLRNASGASYFLTTLLTPSGNDPLEWSAAKLKGFAVGATALYVSGGITTFLKDRTERTRPDGSDTRSFPSGHSTSSSSLTTLSRRNISSISMSPGCRRVSNLALYGIAAGTAWARVEAEKHYPSDVLAGYAIGHFTSAVINDAFLGLDGEEGISLIVEPSRHGINFNLTWRY